MTKLSRESHTRNLDERIFQFLHNHVTKTQREVFPASENNSGNGLKQKGFNHLNPLNLLNELYYANA